VLLPPSAGNPSTGEMIRLAGTPGSCAGGTKFLTRKVHIDNQPSTIIGAVYALIPLPNGDIIYSTADMVVKIDAATQIQHVLAGGGGGLQAGTKLAYTFNASESAGEPWGLTAAPKSWGGGYLVLDFPNCVSTKHICCLAAPSGWCPRISSEPGLCHSCALSCPLHFDIAGCRRLCATMTPTSPPSPPSPASHANAATPTTT
jgi:hypothetical protein